MKTSEGDLPPWQLPSGAPVDRIECDETGGERRTARRWCVDNHTPLVFGLNRSATTAESAYEVTMRTCA